jgi:hypothetical protein
MAGRLKRLKEKGWRKMSNEMPNQAKLSLEEIKQKTADYASDERAATWLWYGWCFHVVSSYGPAEVNAVASTAACSAQTIQRLAETYRIFRDDIYPDVPLALYRACVRYARDGESPVDLLCEALERGWGEKDVRDARRVKHPDDSWQGEGKIYRCADEEGDMAVILRDSKSLGPRDGEEVKVTLRPGGSSG